MGMLESIGRLFRKKTAPGRGLEQLLKEKMEAERRPFLLQAGAVSARLIEKFSGMRGAAEKIREGEPVEAGALGAAIAKEMKANFVQRIFPLLAESRPGASFEELKAFNSECDERLKKVHKINFDNRYLFGLFKKEGERLAAEMKEALSESENLKKAIESAGQAGRPAEILLEKLALLEEKKRKAGGLEAEAARARQLAEAGDAGRKTAAFDAGELDEALKRMHEKKDKAAHAASRIKKSFSALERVFRKHAHKAVKKEAEFIRRLVEEPLEALKEKQGREEAEKILLLLSRSDIEGERFMHEAGKLAGELEGMWGDYKKAEEEKAAAEKSLEPLEEIKRLSEEAGRKAALLAEEEKKMARKIAQAEEEVEELKKEIEEKAKELGISAPLQAGS